MAGTGRKHRRRCGIGRGRVHHSRIFGRLPKFRGASAAISRDCRIRGHYAGTRCGGVGEPPGTGIARSPMRRQARSSGEVASTMAKGHGRPPLKEGQSFGPQGRYTILTCLGEGGMAWVFRVYDKSLQCEKALKIPKFDPKADPALRQRFLLEAQAGVCINHPNVCRFFDVDWHEDLPYITMELINGEPLDRWAETRHPTPIEAAELVYKLGHALQSVHSRGVVHRDIKPSNVMIDRLDRPGEPRLMDFGLARFDLGLGGSGPDAPIPSRLPGGEAGDSDVRSLVGTLPYMAPRGLAESTGRCSQRCLQPWRVVLPAADRTIAVHGRGAGLSNISARTCPCAKTEHSMPRPGWTSGSSMPEDPGKGTCPAVPVGHRTG